MLFWSSFSGCLQSAHTHYVGMIPVESRTTTEIYRITKRSSSGGITDHFSRNIQPSQLHQAEGDYAAMWPSRRKEEIYCTPNYFRTSDHSFERQSLKERRWRRVETSLLDIKQTLNRHDERWENLEKQVAASEKKQPESNANSIVERTPPQVSDQIRHSKDYEAVMKEMMILKEDMKKVMLELRSRSDDDERRIKEGVKAESQKISDILNVINDLEEKIANSRHHHEEGLEQLRIKINQMETKHDDIFNKLSRIESKLDEIQTIMLHSILLLATLLPLVAGIHKGDLIDWHRNGYLAKILVQDMSDNSTMACTGSLISSTSVLTSSRCFHEGGRYQAVVIITRSNGEEMNRGALELFTEGDFAIVRIHAVKSVNLCPKRPEPIRVARLPLSNSLSSPAWQPVDIENMQEARCRIIGFESVEEPTDFTRSNKSMQIEVKLINDGDGIMRAGIDDKRTACWDDTGLPLECMLSVEGEWTQVGVLHSVAMIERTNTDETVKNEDEQMTEEEKKFQENAGAKPARRDNSRCSDAKTMRFAMFYDNTMARLIEKADRIGILATFERCTYNTYALQ
ncbi:hypothetical protein WR25_20038 [Diploscapter pachys]|uniref:Uncharacterized protein n=1 Tax=Diploscapter pachys TaxID=2018661 RepID=A0A2A2JUC8_9BILA|nr:hypothetical protein WR25_20038 [Diploscapter pachys]